MLDNGWTNIFSINSYVSYGVKKNLSIYSLNNITTFAIFSSKIRLLIPAKAPFLIKFSLTWFEQEVEKIQVFLLLGGLDTSIDVLLR